MDSVACSVRMTPELKKRLKVLSAQYSISMGKLIKRGIELVAEELEKKGK